MCTREPYHDQDFAPDYQGLFITDYYDSKFDEWLHKTCATYIESEAIQIKYTQSEGRVANLIQELVNTLVEWLYVHTSKKSKYSYSINHYFDFPRERMTTHYSPDAAVVGNAQLIKGFDSHWVWWYGSRHDDENYCSSSLTAPYDANELWPGMRGEGSSDGYLKETLHWCPDYEHDGYNDAVIQHKVKLDFNDYNKDDKLEKRDAMHDRVTFQYDCNPNDKTTIESIKYHYWTTTYWRYIDDSGGGVLKEDLLHGPFDVKPNFDRGETVLVDQWKTEYWSSGNPKKWYQWWGVRGLFLHVTYHFDAGR